MYMPTKKYLRKKAKNSVKLQLSKILTEPFNPSDRVALITRLANHEFVAKTRFPTVQFFVISSIYFITMTHANSVCIHFIYAMHKKNDCI